MPTTGMRDLRVLLRANRDDLVARYAEICEDLCATIERVGWLRAQSTKESVTAFQRSAEVTVAGRDREARWATVAWDAEAIAGQAAIDALEVERRFLERLL